MSSLMDHTLELTFHEPVPMTDEEIHEYYNQRASDTSTTLFDALDYDTRAPSSSTVTNTHSNIPSSPTEKPDERGSSTFASEDNNLLLPESSAAATYTSSSRSNNNYSSDRDYVEMYICSSCVPFLPCTMVLVMGIAAAGGKGYTWLKSVFTKKTKKNNKDDGKDNNNPGRDSIAIVDGSNRVRGKGCRRVACAECRAQKVAKTKIYYRAQPVSRCRD